MRGWFGARAATFLAIVCGCGALAPQTAAVNITIDYSFDTNNFFSSQVRRDALQAAADFYSDILEDTLVGGTIPSRVTSTVDDGYWEWQLRFTNPSTGAAEIVTSATLAQDEYLIYAGGRPLGGNTLGQGGPGGFAFGRFNNQGEFDDTIQFASNQFPTINQGNSDFQAGFVDRGETDGFVRWGGALTFDSDGSTNWHFGIESGPTSSGQSDFLSVALHELGHTLGLGASSEWTSLVNSGRFQGPAAIAANGGIAPPADFGHWQEGTQSTIYGTFTRQEAALDPIITSGTRK
ncbi:MAG: matrixin family metalloprotease, partial [Planctomycetota bacterium]